MEKYLKGNVNCFELAGGSSYRGFELPGFDCITRSKDNLSSFSGCFDCFYMYDRINRFLLRTFI